MAGFDNSIVARIQSSSDIVDIVGEHVSLAKKGRELVGLCPFHNDHRPSMYVNPEKQIFKCFACGAGGDIFKFIQMRENLSFYEAVQRLAERAGIELKPSKKRYNTSKDDEIDSNRLAKANKWAADLFYKNLQDEQKGQSVREYISERSISTETVDNWQLGFAGTENELAKEAKSKNAPMNILKHAGLVYYRNGNFSDKFVNRLIFPILDVTGRVIGFGGRTLDNNPAKYLNSPATALFDKSNSMFGLDKARHSIVSSGTAVIVEGYMDCIMAHQFRISNVVAALGTSFTDGHARLIRRYAKKVVLLFDSDTAGIEAANRALDVCLAEHIDIYIASVPGEKDPCDYLLAEGKDALQQVIDNAQDVFEYKWQRMVSNFEKNQTHADKKAALEEYLQMLATAIASGRVSSLDKGVVINKFSKVTGLDVREINDELKKRLRRKANNSSQSIENSRVKSFDLSEGSFAIAQREILEVLLSAPIFYKQLKDDISPEDFDVPVLKEIAENTFVLFEETTDVSTAEILSRIESVETGNLAVMLIEAGEKKKNHKERFKGAFEIFTDELKRKNNPQKHDSDDLLKIMAEKRSKQNLRNIGMISD